MYLPFWISANFLCSEITSQWHYAMNLFTKKITILLFACSCLPQVVGMGMNWTGGDIVRYPGGGQKVNLLKPVIEKMKDEKNMIIMFVDR